MVKKQKNILTESFYLKTTNLTFKHRPRTSAAVRRKSWSAGVSHTLSTSHTLSPSSLASPAALSFSGLLWLLEKDRLISPSWLTDSVEGDTPHSDFSLGWFLVPSAPCSGAGARTRAASFQDMCVAKWTHSAWPRAASTRSFVAFVPVSGWQPSWSPSHRASSWAEGRGPHNQRPITLEGRRGAPTTAATEPPSVQSDGPPRWCWGCRGRTHTHFKTFSVQELTVALTQSTVE